MNEFDLLLDQWREQVKEIFPGLHAYQQESMALCVQGLVQSGNAVMQRATMVGPKLTSVLGSNLFTVQPTKLTL